MNRSAERLLLAKVTQAPKHWATLPPFTEDTRAISRIAPLDPPTLTDVLLVHSFRWQSSSAGKDSTFPFIEGIFILLDLISHQAKSSNATGKTEVYFIVVIENYTTKLSFKEAKNMQL